MHVSPSSQKNERLFKILAAVLILAGIAVRLIVYLQNRNLIIDESNVARNIYERGFIALLKPLSYEQYAPPVFLWLVKLSSILFGFGEMALKAYPFLCGIASIYVFYLVLKEYINIGSVWMPLSLLAFNYISIRYGTELKQYASDVLITLCLILLALRTDIQKQNSVRFAFIWLFAGTIAIWASMPSVFVLAGVGVYYIWPALLQRNYKQLWLLSVVYGLWLLQFLLYYITILKPQANSSYLQRFHQDYFLFLIPHNIPEIMHNLYKVAALFTEISNPTIVAIGFIGILVAYAVIYLWRRNFHKSLLVIVPLFCLLIAAGLKQFSLIPRVSLFGIVLFMLLIGIGYDRMMRSPKKMLRIIILLLSGYIVGAGFIRIVSTPFKYEQLTEGLNFMQKKNITAPYLSLYHSSGPAYIYYTQIHPANKRWASLKGADILRYDTPYDSLAWQMNHVWESKGPFGFIFTNQTDQEFNERIKGLKSNLKEADSLDKQYVKAAIFIDK